MTDLIKRLLSWSGTPFDDDAHQAADRIKELTLQLLATSGQAADALDKLAKAEKDRDEYKDAAKIWQEDFIQENQRLYEAKVKLAVLEGK